MGWRAGKTTLCRSQLYPSVRDLRNSAAGVQVRHNYLGQCTNFNEGTCPHWSATWTKVANLSKKSFQRWLFWKHQSWSLGLDPRTSRPRRTLSKTTGPMIQSTPIHTPVLQAPQQPHWQVHVFATKPSARIPGKKRQKSDFATDSAASQSSDPISDFGTLLYVCRYSIVTIVKQS